MTDTSSNSALNETCIPSNLCMRSFRLNATIFFFAETAFARASTASEYRTPSSKKPSFTFAKYATLPSNKNKSSSNTIYNLSAESAASSSARLFTQMVLGADTFVGADSFANISSRFAKDLNSSSLNFTFASAGKGSFKRISSMSKAKSACVSMVASAFESLQSSSPATNFSLSFPVISSICSYTPAAEAYFSKRVFAVFSPTPATPGILSEESPINAFSSTTCHGSIPVFSLKFSAVRISRSLIPFFVK